MVEQSSGGVDPHTRGVRAEASARSLAAATCGRLRPFRLPQVKCARMLSTLIPPFWRPRRDADRYPEAVLTEACVPGLANLASSGMSSCALGVSQPVTGSQPGVAG